MSDEGAVTNDGKQKGWWGRRSFKAKAAIIIVGLIMIGAALGSAGGDDSTPPKAANEPVVADDVTDSGKRLDVATKGFGLHMKLTLAKHWQVLPSDTAGPPPSETIGMVHVGNPPSDESQWWGPDIMIVNGARVHRAADAVSQQPAKADRSKFVPWPSDLFGYLSSLPRVKVIAPPKSVTIGGIRGTQFTVQTPPMHPIIWLKGDSAWIGGGPSGVDPAMTRRITLLNVKGKKLFLGFADSAANFKKRWPMVSELFSSIRF